MCSRCHSPLRFFWSAVLIPHYTVKPAFSLLNVTHKRASVAQQEAINAQDITAVVNVKWSGRLLRFTIKRGMCGFYVMAVQTVRHNGRRALEHIMTKLRATPWSNPGSAVTATRVSERRKNSLQAWAVKTVCFLNGCFDNVEFFGHDSPLTRGHNCPWSDLTQAKVQEKKVWKACTLSVYLFI